MILRAVCETFIEGVRRNEDYFSSAFDLSAGVGCGFAPCTLQGKCFGKCF